mmetsp:Transcript_35237/g.80440  ORF Transcript_35237/g.80440 Transcript_35237/m.80440 type:complete len:336 (-) Transcript_35237:565-1572(-)
MDDGLEGPLEGQDNHGEDDDGRVNNLEEGGELPETVGENAKKKLGKEAGGEEVLENAQRVSLALGILLAANQEGRRVRQDDQGNRDLKHRIFHEAANRMASSTRNLGLYLFHLLLQMGSHHCLQSLCFFQQSIVFRSHLAERIDDDRHEQVDVDERHEKDCGAGDNPGDVAEPRFALQHGIQKPTDPVVQCVDLEQGQQGHANVVKAGVAILRVFVDDAMRADWTIGIRPHVLAESWRFNCGVKIVSDAPAREGVAIGLNRQNAIEKEKERHRQHDVCQRRKRSLQRLKRGTNRNKIRENANPDHNSADSERSKRYVPIARREKNDFKPHGDHSH